MKIYIAGKITGDPEYRFKFARRESKLVANGDIVLNPAALPCNLSPSDYMRICFAMMETADVVAFLPDWDESRGAQVEHAWCKYVGKQTMYLRKE